MKVLAIILALMTGYLSSQSCCLEGEDHCDETEYSTQNCSDEPGKQLQCLPFFSCGACVGFMPSQYNDLSTFFPELLPQTKLPDFSQSPPQFAPTELIKPPTFLV